MNDIGAYIDCLELQFYDITADVVLGKRLKQHQHTLWTLTAEIDHLMAETDINDGWHQVLAQMQGNLYLLQSLIQVELLLSRS